MKFYLDADQLKDFMFEMTGDDFETDFPDDELVVVGIEFEE